ncbi:hypothetical protein GCM10025762_45240 [Haloechinothrix salitolerans]
MDNPAGRLSHVLSLARTLDPETPARDGWAEILNVEIENGNAWQLLRGAARLGQLAWDTRQKIESFEDENPTSLLKHFGEVEGTLAKFLQLQSFNMGRFLDSLSPAGEYCLEMCANRLHARCPQPALKEETRRSLIDQLSTLTADVRAAQDLPPEVRTWTLSTLDTVRDALNDAEMRSASEFEPLADEIVGTLVRKPSYLSTLIEFRIARSFISFLKELDLQLNLAANAVTVGLAIASGAAESPQPVANSVIINYIEQRIEQDVQILDGNVIVGSEVDKLAPPITEQD